jgi:glycine betaine/proline transport system permease protein
MDFLNSIPVMDRTALRELKKGIDLSFKEFSRAYGDGIESFFDPLLYFLIWLEKLLVNSPWPLVIGAFALLAWIGSRSIKLVIGTVICFLIIGYFGMWKNCMATVAIISVSTLVCIVVGIPIGVLMSKSSRAEKNYSTRIGHDANDSKFCVSNSNNYAFGYRKSPWSSCSMHICFTSSSQANKSWD